MKTGKIITVAKQKGGAGASTLTVLIATAIHHRTRKKVLVIDADIQQTVYENRQLEEHVGGTFDIVTFNHKKDNFEKIIQTAYEEYDIIIIDAPGRMEGEDILLFLAVANYVLVPIVASTYDLQSTVSFLRAIESFPHEFDFELFGIINKRDRTLEHKSLDIVKGIAGLKLFDNMVSLKARYKRLSTIDEVVSPTKTEDEFNIFYKEFSKKLKIK